MLSDKQVKRAVSYNRRRRYSSAEVKDIQVAVAARPIDGDWGPKTVNAVAAWQQEHGLDVDGMVGPSTHALRVGARDPDDWPEFSVLVPTSGPELRSRLYASVLEAEKDWHANVGEHDLEDLGKIFADSGWSHRVTFKKKKDGTYRLNRRGEKIPSDWCGMAVGSWLTRAGLAKAPPGKVKWHRGSWYATGNVHCFFTYAKKGARNRKRYLSELDGVGIAKAHAQADEMRRWLDRDTIEAYGGTKVDLDIWPGETCLIADAGDGPHHITMVRAWDPETGILETTEGNASGFAPNGDRRKESVSVNLRDLTNPAHRERIFGIGRPSILDFAT